jgi:hypothetical protein
MTSISSSSAGIDSRRVEGDHGRIMIVQANGAHWWPHIGIVRLSWVLT